MENNIRDFLKKAKINYNEENFKMYSTALTHSSFVHEQKEKVESYERLEFLGDSILGHAVSEYLFKNYDYNQGEMTLKKHSVIDKKYLSNIGRKLNMEKYLLLGAGEKKDNLSNSIYEDVIESLIGAIYMDKGYDEAKIFIDEYINKNVDKIDLKNIKDYKTRLQEHLQSSEKRQSVTYDVKEKRDKNNTIIFVALAKFDSNIIGKGQGFSKKEAEQNSAKDAIEERGIIK